MYFGSVRFFKHLILLSFLVMILIPTVAAFSLRGTVREQEAQLTRQEGQIAELEQSVETLRRQAEQPAEPAPPAPEPAPVFTADEAPYHSLYPDFYAPAPIGELVATPATAYLTFDDGPSATTDQVLDVLAEEGVLATFFVVGREDEASLNRLRRMAEEGHTIGMHTWSHSYRDLYGSVEQYLEDAYRVFTLIRDTTGQTPTVFRFPGGSINSYNRAIYQELIAEMLRRGFVPHDWHLSAGDAAPSGVTTAAVTNNILNNIGSMERAVILLHDGAGQSATAPALPGVIAGLRQRGY
ncbi:MAG: polysaccharide deacetylase, partial [Clostridia bacterium]|nr:polysaccharide deacetylase [Clostridia bacterium]